MIAQVRRRLAAGQRAIVEQGEGRVGAVLCRAVAARGTAGGNIDRTVQQKRAMEFGVRPIDRDDRQPLDHDRARNPQHAPSRDCLPGIVAKRNAAR